MPTKRRLRLEAYHDLAPLCHDLPEAPDASGVTVTQARFQAGIWGLNKVGLRHGGRIAGV